MRAIRTLPAGEMPARARAAPPPGGESIAAAVEAFLTADAPPTKARSNEPSGTYPVPTIAAEASAEPEPTDEAAPDDEASPAATDDEARDRSVVDAVLAMLGPSPVAQLLRMPTERLRGGAGGEGAAQAEDPRGGAINLRELGLYSEGTAVRGLPSFYPTMRPNTPLRTLADLAEEPAALEPMALMKRASPAMGESALAKSVFNDPASPASALGKSAFTSTEPRSANDPMPLEAPKHASSDAPRVTLPPDTASPPAAPVSRMDTPRPIHTLPAPAAGERALAPEVVVTSSRDERRAPTAREAREREVEGDRSVASAPLETTVAVRALDAVSVPDAPADTTRAFVERAPSHAPLPESLAPTPYDDAYDSLFPQHQPLSTRSFLEGSLVPGLDTATTRLELQHPTLGALTLHLAQLGDGVSVDFSAPSLDAAIALRASEEGLRADLKENGTELGGFRVRTRRSAAHEAEDREGGAVGRDAWQPSGRNDRRRI